MVKWLKTAELSYTKRYDGRKFDRVKYVGRLPDNSFGVVINLDRNKEPYTKSFPSREKAIKYLKNRISK